MIQFSCDHCGTPFSVPDSYAGRNGKCKTCGGAIMAPMPTSVEVSSGQSDLLSVPMRTRRLIADQQAVMDAFVNTPLIRVVAHTGDPAEVYRVQYQVRGLRLNRDNEPVQCALHEVEIKMVKDYPRLPPQCRMLTPIFHPNIDESAICIGDHWTAGEDLSLLIIRIGEMIAYQAYNIKSPLNAQAAMWSDLNIKRLPIDSRNVAVVGELV